jgi:glycolate oxidase iron-sulfur subunit
MNTCPSNIDSDIPMDASSTSMPSFDDKLLNCVHCGICVPKCPTYQLTGDENNSPRGRLQMWRAIEEERIPDSPMSDHYTEECVGCLACTSECPANVPYGDILMEKRRQRVEAGQKVDFRIRIVAELLKFPRLFQWLGTPIRLIKKLGWSPNPLLVPGNPAVMMSSAQYAKKLRAQHQPTGPRIGLLTGCLMESAYREINFATIRVLTKLGYQVIIPEDQGCCGAVHEHVGLEGKKELDQNNRHAFSKTGVELILSNSAGCGLALKHGSDIEVEDLMSFLAKQDLSQCQKLNIDAVFIDLPCHLIHGQKHKIDSQLLSSIFENWDYAPKAEDCCGAGGTYNITHPDNSNDIIASKVEFLKQIKEKNVVLATSNHICMQQWNQGIHRAGLKAKVKVRHVIQLVDEAMINS